MTRVARATIDTGTAGNYALSNECTIWKVEYDLGDVAIGSQNCSRAFHQDCILDWVSRESDHGTTFWNLYGDKTKKPSRTMYQFPT